MNRRRFLQIASGCGGIALLGTGSRAIEREVRFSAALSDEQRARLAEIAEKTPVTRTIKAGAPIETRFP